MRAPFELEWMGGAAEHFFRRARPEIEDVPWGTFDLKKYPPALLERAREGWTEVAISEYRAVASFAELVRCLTDAMAPLDLVGMASHFLADEVLHVELAARVAMELGGAAPRSIDPERFAMRRDLGRAAFERANEVVVRACCVAEAFAAGVGAAKLKATSHELPRAVYEIIMADEAHHRRLGSLYLEWATDRMTDEERSRLGGVATVALRQLSCFWNATPAPVVDGLTKAGFSVADLHELGWLESAKAVPHAREVVRTHVIEPLARFGIVVPAEARRDMLV